MGVCAKERKGVTAEVLMATPCTKTPVRGYTYERRGRFIDDDDDVYYYIRWRLQLERFICLFLFLFRLLFILTTRPFPANSISTGTLP